MLTKKTRIQLSLFGIVTVVSLLVMFTKYVPVPAMVGIGHYTVTAELPESGGLYPTSNVTYRGKQVGTVRSVDFTPGGAEAILVIDSGTEIPADVAAGVHSMSAIGEQYLELTPRSGGGALLEEGSTIDATVPPQVGPLIDRLNSNLAALPKDSITTVIDESYKAFNGAGPSVARLLDSTNLLLGKANENLPQTTRLITDLGTFLDSQAATADEILTWSAGLNTLTGQLSTGDPQLRSILDKGPAAAAQATDLFERLRPTLPILLSNLTTVGQVGVTYNASLEQILVLYPMLVEALQSTSMPNRNNDFGGGFLAFQLNLNIPPPCTSGFIPAAERRTMADLSIPPTPTDLYCKLPQGDASGVRGARNLPCIENPGRRGPSVQDCASPEGYEPEASANPPFGFAPAGLVEPQAPVQTAPAAEYDPDTGRYQGPDGKFYVDASLKKNNTAGGGMQSLLVPSGG